MNNNTPFLDALVGYFKSGIKKEPSKELGVEIEHFILNQDSGYAVSYYGKGGIGEILSRLIELYPKALPVKEGDCFLGFVMPDFNITLEPAGQLEISIAHNSQVSRIGEIYKGFMEKCAPVLKEYNAIALAVGCQPKSRVKDLRLIPKERYRLMDRYFSEAHTDGIQMMRGTCSTQVSIDFRSEADFRRKIQAAYYYTPFFKLISNNSLLFQGERVGFLKRTDIWNRTDPLRCGVVPGVFKDDFGFLDYAGFLAKMPLIFSEKDGREIYTGMRASEDVYSDAAPDKDECAHIVSMAFPDVRLKQYLEIRAADSMPIEFVLSYTALIKGLMYSDEALNEVQSEIAKKNINEASIKSTEQNLMRNGWKGEIYGEPASDFAKKTIHLASHSLSDLEKELMLCLSSCS